MFRCLLHLETWNNSENEMKPNNTNLRQRRNIIQSFSRRDGDSALQQRITRKWSNSP
jgi:hypothetical protein